MFVNKKGWWLKVYQLGFHKHYGMTDCVFENACQLEGQLKNLTDRHETWQELRKRNNQLDAHWDQSVCYFFGQ